MLQSIHQAEGKKVAVVIPAHAGIQILLSCRLTWMPVFTGMTDSFSALFLTTLGFIFAL